MADGPIIDYSTKARSNSIEGNSPSDITKAREAVAKLRYYKIAILCVIRQKIFVGRWIV